MSTAVRPHPIHLAALLLAAALVAGGSCRGGAAKVVIDGPVHGTFLNGTQVTVDGRLQRPGRFTGLAVNGIPVPVASTFSVAVPVDPTAVFNRIVAEGTLASGAVLRDALTVVVGDGVDTGFVLDRDFVPAGVALRVTDTGFAQITPVIEGLSTGALDIGDLITGQNPIATGNFGGIVSYKANVVEVGFGGFGLDAAPTASGVDTTITIDDFFLGNDLDLDWLGSCTLEVETASTTIQGAYDLAPLAADPSHVDVNLVSPVAVGLGGFGSRFVSGICDDPVIGSIIQSILDQGEIQQLMQDGFQDNLADPDGAGPLDSPVAGAIQEALTGISIAGPVGAALGGVVEAPIASITEEPSGITLTADAAMYSVAPHPDAPDLPASYTVAEGPPVFGPTTPGGLPYGLAFAVSTSSMNQLIKTQIANGLLQEDITEFLGLPLTTGLLLFIPEFLTAFPPDTPAIIRIHPTLAPVFTGAPGPQGEFMELAIGALELEILLAQDEQRLLALEIDMDAGVDLTFTPTGMAFGLATPPAGHIDITVTDNPLAVDEANLASAFQQLFPLFADRFSYQVAFDVVAAPGEQWTLDVQHAISGALDRISDGYNDGIGFQDGGGNARCDSAVAGSVSVDGGPPVAFDFTPSATLIDDGVGGCSCDQDVPFGGSASTQLTGAASAHLVLEFSFQIGAFSNSNTAFPTANGDEMAIRLGKNDTIDDNFTAGGYPGAGARNIADDGHRVSVRLTTQPLP